MKHERIVTVFGSAVPREGSEEYKNAYELGALLARGGFTVCNGGYAGTMEASAKGAAKAGGKTIGVTVRQFGLSPNPYISRIVETESLFGRLKELLELSHAYIVLKGGSGTLLELVFSIELILKGLSEPRPVIVVGDFFKGVIDLIRSEATKYEKGRTLGVANKLDEFLSTVATPKQALEELKKRFE